MPYLDFHSYGIKSFQAIFFKIYFLIKYFSISQFFDSAKVLVRLCSDVFLFLWQQLVLFLSFWRGWLTSPWISRWKVNQISLTFVLDIIVPLSSFLVQLSTQLLTIFGLQAVWWLNCFLDRWFLFVDKLLVLLQFNMFCYIVPNMDSTHTRGCLRHYLL